MVGNEKSYRNSCVNVPGLHCVSERWRECTARIGISERGDPALEGKPCPYDADAENKAAAETATKTGLPDPRAGGAVLVACPSDAALGKILPYRVVYRLPTQRHYRPKVVDGES
jgi:hypothetical protein